LKTLVIGDIHGCFVELQALLDKAGLSSSDTIIALGDIVDRGPESPQVLEFFRKNSSAHSLMGNHERKHIRSYHHIIQHALSQIITRSQLGDGYPEAVAFMASLPRFIEINESIVITISGL
jgi:serine/threonine protein phosphatase 1